MGLTANEWRELGITEAVSIGAGLSIEQSKLKAEELLVSAARHIVTNFSMGKTKLTGH